MINTANSKPGTPESPQKTLDFISGNIHQLLTMQGYGNAKNHLNKQDILDGLVRLENETWPEGTRAAREAFESRIQIFPEGVYFYEESGDFGGLSTSLITELENPNTIKSWEEITDYGFIKNHNPNGNALYVVSVGVSPRFQGKGIGKNLVAYQVELAKQLGLQYLVLGSRVPEYHKYSGNIEDYLTQKNEYGKSIDSLVRFYQGCGLEIGKIKSDYMEDDKESRNYGVIMYKKFF